jgi:hypothetical protein
VQAIVLSRSFGTQKTKPHFPAINRRAIVNCSFGTSPGVHFHHLPVSSPDKSFGTSPAFNHTACQKKRAKVRLLSPSLDATMRGKFWNKNNQPL